MSEKYIPKIIAFTAQDAVTSGWVKRVYDAITRDRQAVRATVRFTIEAQFPNDPTKWGMILLPNGGYRFSTLDDVLAVLDMLEGKTPIPEIPNPEATP